MIFPEGQDPLDQGGAQPGRMPIGPHDRDPFDQPRPVDIIGAAFREHNMIAWIIDPISRSSPASQREQGYEPVDHIVGTKYEPYLNQFLGDVNHFQTDARMLVIDREMADQKILNQAGWTGTFVSIAAFALNPLWFAVILVWVLARSKRSRRLIPDDVAGPT